VKVYIVVFKVDIMYVAGGYKNVREISFLPPSSGNCENTYPIILYHNSAGGNLVKKCN
jgi:hypothetical protein